MAEGKKLLQRLGLQASLMLLFPIQDASSQPGAKLMVRTTCRHTHRNSPGCCCTILMHSLHHTNWPICNKLAHSELVLWLAVLAAVQASALGLAWVAQVLSL